MSAAKLDKAIKTVCPIDGVSIGRKDDKSTWRIDFRPEATQTQRDAAQAILSAFIWDDTPQPPMDLLDWFNDLSPARKGLFRAELSKP